jgi:hypothetical protein
MTLEFLRDDVISVKCTRPQVTLAIRKKKKLYIYTSALAFPKSTDKRSRLGPAKAIRVIARVYKCNRSSCRSVVRKKSRRISTVMGIATITLDRRAVRKCSVPTDFLSAKLSKRYVSFTLDKSIDPYPFSLKKFMKHGNIACKSIIWRKSLEHWKSGNHRDVQNEDNFLRDICNCYRSKIIGDAHSLKIWSERYRESTSAVYYISGMSSRK